MDVPGSRLRAQRLAGVRFDAAAGVVAWMGAVQSQDYAAACWAVGLRCQDATRQDVEAAYDAGSILRTHVMRPTWHFVAPADARALVELTGPRVLAGVAGRHRRLELDAATISRALDVFTRRLEGGRHLTRRELGQSLEDAGISPAGQRLPHLIMVGELQGLVISGRRRGRDLTYALFDERVPPGPRTSRDEALRALALTYFRSHGPAQLQDFTWWSGLTQKEARAALEEGRDGLQHVTIGAKLYHWADAGQGGDTDVHLLPNFDEYTVGYRDRSDIQEPAAFDAGSVWLGALGSVVSIGGRLRGGWRRQGRRLELTLTRRPTAQEHDGIVAAALELARFHDMPPLDLEYRVTPAP